MKNAVFASDDFMVALKDLSEKDVPVRTAYRLKKILDQVGKSMELFHSTRTQVLEKHCIKWEENDEEKGAVKGKPKIENSQYTFTPDSTKALAKDLDDLLNIEFVIDDTIKLDDLGDVKVATKTLILLDEVFEEFKKEKKEKKNVAKKEKSKKVAEA